MADTLWTDGRLMSFALTARQLLDGSKTVTRRTGWKTLQPGTRLRAVRRMMGLRRGEKPELLAVIEVIAVRRERLDAIDDADVAREGFAGMTAAEFVAFFVKKIGARPDDEVTRIEFRLVHKFGQPQLGLSWSLVPLSEVLSAG